MPSSGLYTPTYTSLYSDSPQYPTINIGRLVLAETPGSAAETVDTLSVSGQESMPPLTEQGIARLQDDLLGLPGAFVPVEFTDKASRDGFYTVTDASADLVNWGDTIITCDWSLELQRAGTASEVDVEARLTGRPTRVNDHGYTGSAGERWHAPPIGHTAYWTSSTTPTTVVRTGSAGAMTVYRGVPVDMAPRYSITLASYLAGAVTFTDSTERIRTGIRFDPGATGWTLDNTLVRVTPVSGGGLSVDAWTSGGWATKTWQAQVNGTPLADPSSCSVLRNDPEIVIARLTWMGTATRTTLDLTLRRGSRFVELYLQTSTSATLKVVRTSAEAGTAATGYIRATSNDAAGNRYVIGSARSYTADTTNGGLSKTTTTTLDAMIGVELGGSSAVAGDQAAHLYAQYLGSPSEIARPAHR